MQRYAVIGVSALLILILIGYGVLFATGRFAAIEQTTTQPMEVCVEAQSGAVGTSCNEGD